MQKSIWHASLRLTQQVACPIAQSKVLKLRHPANPNPHARSWCTCSSLKVRWARDRGRWIKETQVMGPWNNCFRPKLLSGKLRAGELGSFQLSQVVRSCSIVRIKKSLATDARVNGAYVRLIGSLELGSGRSAQGVQNISWNGGLETLDSMYMSEWSGRHRYSLID